MNSNSALEQVASRARVLKDKGLLLEAGFAAFAHFVLPKAAHRQVLEMRHAYMAGAEHLFSALEPGSELTEAYMRRLELIHKEILAWRAEIKNR